MDWQSDIIKEKNFRRLVFLIMSSFTVLIVWAGISELQDFNTVWNNSVPANGQKSTTEIGNLRLTKMAIEKEGKQHTVHYITVQDLTYGPNLKKAENIISNRQARTKIMGLKGHPSFLAGKDEGFWKSQFYLQLAFAFGGWLAISIFFIVVTGINFKQQKKLFTETIKKLFTSLFFLIFAGFIAKAVLYGRIIHFLNNNYYLGESLTGGISLAMVWVMAALFFIIIFLERAVPMQKEQDLTI